MLGFLAAGWRYRQFISSSVQSEFAARYARSRLGALWMVVNPLAQAAIVAFVLSSVLAVRLPDVTSSYGYALYLMAGTLAWALFQECVIRCLTVFTDNGNLLKKLVFPRICLPLVVVGICGVAHTLLAGVTLVVFLVLGQTPTVHWLWLPVLGVLTLALAMGLGLLLGVVNVFLRDVAQVTPIVLQFLYWLTPIIYVPDIVPQAYRPWLALNPLSPLVGAYQSVMVYDQPPQGEGLLALAALSAVLLGSALLLFRRAAPEITDAL
jgi:lipopolysaccharide transport system permease protein